MTSPRLVTPLLLGGFDYIWARLVDRLAGLTQDEYLWEPAADCWNVREQDGQWLIERPMREPDPAPVTTIAWRMWHIGSDCLAGYVHSDSGEWALPVRDLEWHGDPDTAQRDMQAGYDAFRSHVVALGEERMWQPLGPKWGPYGDDSWAALVVHALDEVAHHGAEIGLLRDLYRNR